MTKVPPPHRHRIRRAMRMVWLALWLSPLWVSAEEAGTECLFEFNKAYSWNQSGKEQLEMAQQQAARANPEAAKQRYERAIDLLEKSIQHYEQLPELAFDCSPTNLSIARNNIRIARENLELARRSYSGLDCLKTLDELDSLTNLASEYYYERNDAVSARQSAEDALAMAERIAADGICTGSYEDTLAEQTRYARQVVDSLKKRGRYDRCMNLLEQARRHYEQANRREANDTRAWRRVRDAADKALTSDVCDEPYLKTAEDLRRQAERRLSRLE